MVFSLQNINILTTTTKYIKYSTAFCHWKLSKVTHQKQIHSKNWICRCEFVENSHESTRHTNHPDEICQWLHKFKGKLGIWLINGCIINLWCRFISVLPQWDPNSHEKKQQFLTTDVFMTKPNTRTKSLSKLLILSVLNGLCCSCSSLVFNRGWYFLSCVYCA